MAGREGIRGFIIKLCKKGMEGEGVSGRGYLGWGHGGYSWFGGFFTSFFWLEIKFRNKGSSALKRGMGWADRSGRVWVGRGEKEEKEEGGWQCFALVEKGGG